MKRALLMLLCLMMLLSLAGCGGKNRKNAAESADAAGKKSSVVEIRMTMDNFFDYFEFHEFRSPTKNDNGDITSVQILYGYRLKEGFEAANLPDYRDTLQVNFRAEGVVKEGDFTIDFDTLQYTGTESNIQVVDIEEDLVFWPKGNRTEIWAFGLYSTSYVMFFKSCEVTSVRGSIFLKNNFDQTPALPAPQPGN